MAAHKAQAAWVAAFGLVFATLFFTGGSDEGRLVWIGGAAVVLACLAGVAALAGTVPVPRLEAAGLVFLVALVLLVAWTGASLAWSIVPDRSWDELDRGIVYIAFAFLGVLLAGLLARPQVKAAVGLAVLLGLVLGWALLGKVFPALYAPPPGSPITRLRNPIGYWNALALLGDAALPLALWIAAPRRGSHAVRVAGVLLFYASVVAVLLTYSRTGVVVGALVVIAWLALAPDRLEGLAATAIGLLPGIAVSVFAFSRSGLSHFEPHSARVHDGAWFGVVLLLGAALVGAATFLASRWENQHRIDRPSRRVLERKAGLILGVAVAIAVAALAFRSGGPASWWRDFTNPVLVGSGSQRLTSASSNNRWTWWKEAGRVFAKAPLEGKGAGSFQIARRPIRHNPLNVTEPHSTPLQFLSELGIVGFLLGLAAAVAATVAVIRAVRRLNGAALALGLGVAAYGVHSLFDYDWEFVAVTGPALLVVGLLAGSGRPVRVPARRPVAAGIALVTTLAALYSLGAPWLSAREVNQSYAALDRTDVAGAASKARSARRLNPFSYDPLWALAAAYQLDGNPADAIHSYERAVELQPENSDTWYALGQYEYETGRFAQACYALDRAYGLDPRGPAGDPGGLLDRVKKRLPGCPAA